MTLEAAPGRRHLGFAPCPTCGARTRVTRTGVFFRHPALALDVPDGRLDYSRDCGASGKPYGSVWDGVEPASDDERGGAS